MHIKIVIDSSKTDGKDKWEMGFLHIDEWKCYVLRRLPPGHVMSEKLRPLRWVRSPRLRRWTLRVDVTPFLIHSGNDPADSLGCFLPGLRASTWRVMDSKAAVAEIEGLCGCVQGVDKEVGTIEVVHA